MGIENDICLLELETPATLGSNVAAISLPYKNEEYDEGTNCIVSGWGTTSEGGSLASVLQKVTVPVVSDKHCRDSYGASSITDSMICAGLDQGGKDSCQGDSGGPFMCGNQLSGVVSWAMDAPRPATPVSTPRPATLSTGSTTICKPLSQLRNNKLLNGTAEQNLIFIPFSSDHSTLVILVFE